MFGFSMVKLVRQHGHRLDRELRHQLVNLYRPFKLTPCFLHKSLESRLKKTKKIPVIIEFHNEKVFLKGIDSVNKIVQSHKKSKVKSHYSRISCCSAELTPMSIEKLLTTCDCIKKIHFDREVHALLNVAVPTIHADNVKKNNTTLTGKGINIAIVDTGIYPHKDLEGRIIHFKDFVGNKTKPYDDNGHGTHCAGDAAGNGALSEGKYAGSAPEANLIGVKVLNKMGSGSLSTIIDGVQWCIDYNEDDNHEHKIDIISMSLGGSPEKMNSEDSDPMVSIVEKAWDSGIVVCVAAGNEGPDPKTISSPGLSNKVITVGAMDDKNTNNTNDDIIAKFSSRGPTIYGVEKPDIVAPGVNIISLRSPSSFLDKTQKSSRVDENYLSLSGTSMATPICAGAVALLLESQKDLTPDQVKEMLIKGAKKLGDDPNVYGAGYVDVEQSVK
ncbi:S8 family peptidase [Scopulibacillus cellulosilyticus]|uniref:S8 family peptidase n=1 Tax=Scopulibacillus cellulosilyticus TaxID=2665665 RepID=A0ABW2PQU0_9BACL